MSALMIQGTGSNVGKSLIVAGLCRAFKNRGLRVAPFKPQNMSNNAAVTSDGGEIGRAQALQARACRLDAITDMNPVLLKPESEIGAQVVVQGKRVTTLTAREYFRERSAFMPAILESFNRLKKSHDLVMVEGAGSPAEVNLRDRDLANMGFAEAAGLPVVLVGDIHRGGIIASLVGTKNVLSDADNAHIRAFLINNFHGDVSLFDDGVKIIEAHTGWQSAGILPHFEGARKLPAEDALSLDEALETGGALKIAVPRLSRIANFDDLDPLNLEENVEVTFAQPGEALPGEADLILLPGSKSTIADMKFFRAQGWDIDLYAHVRRGGRVLGLCGGYQMLGQKIHDPDGIEGKAESIEGLGLLDVETILTPEKSLVTQSAHHIETGTPMTGYEMHIGETKGESCNRPFAMIDDRSEGAVSKDGLVQATYLHGIFSSDNFRRAYIENLGVKSSNFSYDTVVDEVLDALAEHMSKHLDLDLLLDIARSDEQH